MGNGIIFVIDDDPVSATQTAGVLRAARLTTRTFDDGESLVRHLGEENADIPACCIIDLCLPDMTGVRLLKTLRERYPSLPVILCSAYSDTESVVESMKLGATDFLDKPISPSRLLDAVHSTLRHNLGKPGRTPDLRCLTPREREIAALLVQGLSSKQIGRELAISNRTVDSHRQHILEKSGCASIVELARSWQD